MRAVAAFAHWRLPYAIAREAVVALPGTQGSQVLAGGMFPDDTSSARAIRVELPSGRTQPLAALGTSVHDVAAGLYAGAPALFGGGNSAEQSVVQVLRGGVWQAVAQLPTTRSDLSIVQVAGTTAVIGGYDGIHVPRAILTPDGRGGFRTLGQLSVGVRYAATAVVGSDVYVFGGEVNQQELDSVQRFDAAQGTTEIVTRLPRALGHAMAAVVGDRILLVGGRIDPNTQTAAMWWFDPATGRFTRAGSLPAPTSDAAVVVRGNDVWLLGGENPSVTDRVIDIHVS